jgi:hypothetical protein
VIRLAELYHHVKFPEALTILRQWRGWTPLYQEVTGFYRMQLHRHAEAVAYLDQRGIGSPEVIEHMQIGYAPGRCLRAWLMQLGYALPDLREAGLVTAEGYDAYSHRIVFPLECNLYGRSIGVSAPPHRFLPGSKGGLYGWDVVQHCPEVILVEGLFDYAVLWQSGFRQVTCAWATISTAGSSSNCAMGCELSISRSMRIRMAVGSKPRNGLLIDFGRRALTFAASSCPMDMIQTLSSSRAATRGSSSCCWRPLSHEIPSHLSTEFRYCPEPSPYYRTACSPRD